MKYVWIVFSENMFWGVYKSAERAYGAVLDELSELALDANEGYDEESKAIYEYYEKQAAKLTESYERAIKDYDDSFECDEFYVERYEAK